MSINGGSLVRWAEERDEIRGGGGGFGLELPEKMAFGVGVRGGDNASSDGEREEESEGERLVVVIKVTSHFTSEYNSVTTEIGRAHV